MSGETGMQKTSPRLNVVADNTVENTTEQSEKETILLNNMNSTASKCEITDDHETDDVQEVAEFDQQEPSKMIDDEEMPTYTSIPEMEDKNVQDKSEDQEKNEDDDDTDRHSIDSCSTEQNLDLDNRSQPDKDEELDRLNDSQATEPNSDDSSINSSSCITKWQKVNDDNEDDDMEKQNQSDDEDEEKDMLNYEEEDEIDDEEDDELDDEEEDELDDINEYADDDIQVVEDSDMEDDEFVSLTNVERASSEDYERRQNKVIKSEIEGKKSHSFQDLSNTNLLTKSKRISPTKQTVATVESNRVANPLKASYLKSLKPGPKSYRHIPSKVKQYILDMKGKSAEGKRKSEEDKFDGKRQSEDKEIKTQQRQVKNAEEKQRVIEQNDQRRIKEKFQALQTEYSRANSEYEKLYTNLKPVPFEKVNVYEVEEVHRANNEYAKPGITIRPAFIPVDLTNSGVEILRVQSAPENVQKMEVDTEKVLSSVKSNININGATKDITIDYPPQSKVSNGKQEVYDKSYNDYMKIDKKNEEMANFLVQLISKNTSLQTQIDLLRKKEADSKKITRDMGVQTDTPKTSETSTSINEWSDNPDCTLPSLDFSSQSASTNLSQRLSHTFLTSSRILETFTTVSRQLKEDEGNTTLIPSNTRKRKFENAQDDETHSFKVPNLGSSKSGQSETDKNKITEDKKEDDMKCYIYKEDENSAERSFLIKVQDPLVEKDKDSVKVDRKCGPYLIGNLEIMMSELNGTINVWGKEISQTSSSNSKNLNSSVESMERRTLRARRTMNPLIACSTEKKPHDHERLSYRSPCTHCHENRQRMCERVGPANHYSQCYRSANCCKKMHMPPRHNDCCQQLYYDDPCMHTRERRHRCYESCMHQPKFLQDDEDYEHDHNHEHNHKDLDRATNYCYSNQERSGHCETVNVSNLWQPRSTESTLYNGKVDSGVHSDTLSNQEDDSPYLPTTGHHEVNKVRKRRTPVKSLLKLLKSCSGDVHSSTQNRSIPKMLHNLPSTSDMIQDTKCEANYIHHELDRRIRESDNSRSRSNVLKMVKSHYSDSHGN